MRARKCFIFVWSAVAGFLACALDCAPALAQREPVIVVPGRPGYQVMFWGQDVSGAVIEGEFGLDRPGNVGFTVLPPPRASYAGVAAPAAPYYPATGEKPRYGRLEVVPKPNRPLPPAAPTYYRSWTSESPHLPATAEPPAYPPPVILAPPVVAPAPRPPRGP